ncbi:extracellular protease [Actinoplanes sp. NBRC 14428]|uniref:Serine protease n=1 Tax=Pseudosporangium ferrugineum TaxID=439699 RepID=A0A2T0SB34_9ACTN|nr:S8 family peptidase [Pseudosporangium ferrugineum]PRY30634.1 serine protease [Pseudosporangium ferrugineum]BCJ50177.1 extracellular protease [Actinoplanes sp. NBRC 14428]
MERKRCAAALAVAATAVVTLSQPATAAPSDAAAPGAAEVTNQYIVKFKDGADRADVLRRLGTRFGARLSDARQLGTGARLIRADRNAAGLLQALAASDRVEYAEPDVMLHALSVPNDPEYPAQWHYSEPAGGINGPGAWDVTKGSGVVVAVIDTGRTAHPDLDANTVAGYDFISSASNARDGNGRDSNPQDEGDWNATAGECGPGSEAGDSSWHGTHVAGTIAAVSDNGVGVAGVAPQAKVQHARVLGKCGGALSDITDAIVWASGGSVSGVPANATPARVINMSLGGSGRCTRAYQSAITAAVRRGTTVVVASGNSNADGSGYNPGNCNNVVSVSSLNRAGNRAFYSNFGSTVDIAAPGGEVRRATDAPGTRTTPQDGVLSTLNAGTTTPAGPAYKTYMGTSMAAPHVAGVAALLLSHTPGLTPAQAEAALKDTARPIPGSCPEGCGAGLVDAAAAVR